MTAEHHDYIRVLIADDDEHVLEAYQEAFSDTESTQQMQALEALAAELFDPEESANDEPHFDVVACSQGEEAIALAEEAAREGNPFDVVILDVRMPPGIDGVEAGSRIRKLDPDVQIIFVSGYSDVPMDDLQSRVQPAVNLHYFHKPLSFEQLAKHVASLVREH